MSKNKFGKYPFEKGIYKNMYQDKLWTMRQYAGFSSVTESNKRYLKLIENGVSGLSVAFDLPTQMGYDSDDDMSFGEVGKSVFQFQPLKILIVFLKILILNIFQFQ